MKAFCTNYGPLLAEQWRRDFPKRVSEFECSGRLEAAADAAAYRAAERLVTCLDKGIAFDEAFFFATNLRTPFESGE